MNFKGILFDFDGTILDTSGLIIASLQHVAKVHCGKVLSEADLRPILGRTMRDTMQVLAPGWPQEPLIATYRAHQIANEDRISIFPTVEETLMALNAVGIRMAIVTSRRRETAICALERFGIEKYFSVVVGAHQCKKHKPDPEPLYMALDALQLTSAECVMVGDSPADLAGGHNAGMKSAVVRWSYMDWACLREEKPEYVLEYMADLKEIVGYDCSFKK